MNRIFKIAIFDLKKTKTIKNLMLTITIFLIMSYILSINIGVTYIPLKFKMFFPYIFLFNTFFILGCEFENNTDKILFTGIFKRHEILLSKISCMIIKGIIIWLSYVILDILINILIVQNINFTLSIVTLLKSLLSVIIYSFTIGSIILLISLLTNSSKLSGIIVYILFSDLMLAFFNNAITSDRLNPYIKDFIKNLPFYIANTGITRNGYSLVQLISLLLTGISCLYITIILLNKKNI